MANKFGLKVAAIVLASASVFTACSSSAPATSGSAAGGGTKTLKIGVTFPILDQFLQKVADAITAEAKAKGVEVNIVAADEKTDTQLGQVENFVSQKVDGIIVIPVDTDAAGPMTDAAKGANIPLVYVNRKPADLPSGVPYVGSDSLYAGTVEMQELAKLAGGQGNVVILQGDPANEAAVQRTKGCNDVVAQNPGMKVIKTQAGNWYREKGQSIMENWLQSGDDIKVVCANNDEMALGAINAIKADNKKLGADGILVGGVDATADALAAMTAGDLAVTVFQDAAGQGKGGVDAVVDLANGQTVKDYVDIPYQLVTPDNMADFASK
ncbi:MAG: rhizopine-binding protein [Actinobacteria bacterium HGW-Actinobacteria-5]|jgi:inositol transport system substrate-binding protein|nr:MAG: rhizopine-binding protein [Actinobacteria bacterium HGW-Actinobacteria-5]